MLFRSLYVNWDFEMPNIKFERGLEKLVNKCGGKESGSGAGFGQRDISYYGFKTRASAEKAAKLVHAALENSGRTGIQTAVEEDGCECQK